MPRHCLPEHLRDKRHNDWLWPFSYIPRAWNAFCGQGPLWKGQQQPIPSPGRSLPTTGGTKMAPGVPITLVRGDYRTSGTVGTCTSGLGSDGTTWTSTTIW
ncbi:hypothetical protein LCGC14_1205940 [marine sediment metagenome]|uniref:Uncharacterized protein n=1 Tax=marine sediment metagenome TaxID=412755 RepID=A0A0F9NXR4_9ZZZZ